MFSVPKKIVLRKLTIRENFDPSLLKSQKPMESSHTTIQTKVAHDHNNANLAPNCQLKVPKTKHMKTSFKRTFKKITIVSILKQLLQLLGMLMA